MYVGFNLFVSKTLLEVLKVSILKMYNNILIGDNTTNKVNKILLPVLHHFKKDG